jgi:hypothetical protein
MLALPRTDLKCGVHSKAAGKCRKTGGLAVATRTMPKVLWEESIVRCRTGLRPRCGPCRGRRSLTIASARHRALIVVKVLQIAECLLLPQSGHLAVSSNVRFWG